MERFVLKDPLKQNKTTKEIAGYVNENGCFICDTYAPNNKGYYYITRVVNGVKTGGIAVHRYVYETYNGKIDEGLVVRHKCDNPSCINPDHLELGTHQDNMDDMVKRGRSTKGEKSASCKLSDEQVEEIKRLLESGMKQVDIAKMYNVSDVTIYYIKVGVRK